MGALIERTGGKGGKRQRKSVDRPYYDDCRRPRTHWGTSCRRRDAAAGSTPAMPLSGFSAFWDCWQSGTCGKRKLPRVVLRVPLNFSKVYWTCLSFRHCQHGLNQVKRRIQREENPATVRVVLSSFTHWFGQDV